jgi:hypothetical protein
MFRQEAFFEDAVDLQQSDIRLRGNLCDGNLQVSFLLETLLKI